MLEFKQALEIVLDNAQPLPVEKIKLSEAYNRILGEDFEARVEMPPFDKSAVDGYACREEDMGEPLKVIGEIAAGEASDLTPRKGECIRIMTGAKIPENTNFVVMLEDTKEEGENIIRVTRKSSKDNICLLAEDVQKGTILLKKGTRLKAPQIAILASQGEMFPRVFFKPNVGIICTGDEIKEPDEEINAYQIYNSNAYQLIAQITEIGGKPNYYGISMDSKAQLKLSLEKAIKENEVVLFTGGASVGHYDFVPDIIAESGAKIFFKTIAVQPGKPTLFAKKDRTAIFALPGNPVSTLVQTELLIKPYLLACMQAKRKEWELELPMGADFTRRKTKRMVWIPIDIRDGKVYPIEYHGSGHINSYAEADGIIALEINQSELKKGTIVNVRPV